MNYKIVKCSLKIVGMERTLNKWAKEGWKFKTVFTGKGIFFPCAFLVLER